MLGQPRQYLQDDVLLSCPRVQLLAWRCCRRRHSLLSTKGLLDRYIFRLQQVIFFC